MSDLVVRGAREHNLAGIDLDLPRGALIVFTGVSGSGKSSLAFDTLHAEGQRRYLEALAANVRRFAGKLRRPDVDVVLGLPPTIALDQRGGAASSRSSVGTLTEIVPILRVLFARAGVQHCPYCGSVIRPETHDEIVGKLMRLPEGARLTLEAPVRVAGDAARVLDEIARAGFSRIRLDDEVVRLEEADAAKIGKAKLLRIVVDRLRIEPDRRDRLHDAVRTTSRAGHGVLVATTDAAEQTFVDRPYCVACDRTLPALEPGLLSPNAEGACPECHGRGHHEDVTCKSCGGTGLREEARAVRWQGRSLPEVLGRPIQALRAELAAVTRDPITTLPLEEIGKRLDTLAEVGLTALTLDRRATDVSTGEMQRLRLARQVGAGLSGVLYVLDEPSAGLHPREIASVVSLLRKLKDLGNTVLAVDHHAEVIEAADLVVDFGPGPGVHGGRVVFQGTVAELRAADTPTGRWLSGRERLQRAEARPVKRKVRVRGVRWRGLNGLDVDLPLDAMVAVTGPSGSGKTALLEVLQGHLRARLDGDRSLLPDVRSLDGLEAVTRLVVVDRAPLGRTARSNPATYTGLWEVVRDLLASTKEARVRGLEAGFFSLGQKGGRCEACSGSGWQTVDLGLLPDVYVPCDVCKGRRFSADVLEVTWKGLSPDQLLDLSVEEAHAVLAGHPRLDETLRALADVGLGYLALGQPAHTLSGGEAQRLRLARELTRAVRGGAEGTLFLVDDPTVGLHPADVAVLHRLFGRLVGEGATVWLATHDLALADAADHRIDLPG
jgi:excinuclease ABC subunit A